GKVAGVEHLNAGVMRAVERRYRGGATGFSCVSRIIEPHAEVVHLNRIEGRVDAGVRERSAEHNGRRRGAGSVGKGFDAENSDELLAAFAVLVGLDIVRMPGKAKLRVGHLQNQGSNMGM